MEYLKSIRQAKGMSVEELAQKCGITTTMVWSYESGRRSPPLDVLCKLADVLDVSLDMLVRGKEKDRPEGRSLDSLIKEYRSKSEEELQYMQVMLQAVLADKRYQDHLSKL